MTFASPKCRFALTVVHTGVYNVPRETSYMKAIDEWLRKTGMPEWKLGTLAAANAKAVERIRNGTARVETLNDVLNYMRRNPPPRSRRAKRVASSTS